MKVKAFLIYLVLIVATLAHPDQLSIQNESKPEGIIRDIGCISCKAVIAAFSFLVLNPVSVKVIEAVGYVGCSAFLYDMNECYRIVAAWFGLVATQLKAKTFQPDFFCSMILGICKSSSYKYLDPKEDIARILSDKPEFLKNNDYIDNLYKQIAEDKKAGKKRETILLYHLSDLHFLIDYKEGTSNKWGKMTCWNLKAGKPKNQNETAGKWGDYNCDSSPRTLEQIGEVIKETGPPEFMLWTGDNVDHAQYLEPRDTTATTVLVTDFVNRWCPKAVIFPIHGNHEFVGMGQQDFSLDKDPVIMTLSKSWSKWLTPEVKQEYENKTYFSYESTTHPNTNADFDRKMNKTRIISFNTESAYGYNFYVAGELNDPGQQFEWLESLLKQMEKDGEIAIIIGHHSPGYNDFVYPFASRLRALYDRYQHIIRLSLFGHTHYEEFHVVRGVFDNKPIGTMHVSPSYTPWTNQNPSFRVITLDVETKLPIKIVTRTLDLIKANADDKDAKFFPDHEFAEAYDLPDLSPSSTLELANKINTDEQTAIKYKVNMLAHGNGSADIIANGCDDKCRRMTSCHVSYSVVRDQRNWMKVTDIP